MTKQQFKNKIKKARKELICSFKSGKHIGVCDTLYGLNSYKKNIFLEDLFTDLFRPRALKTSRPTSGYDDCSSYWLGLRNHSQENNERRLLYLDFFETIVIQDQLYLGIYDE